MKGLGFVLSGVLALGSSCATSSPEDVADSARARCSTLRDHVVDLRLKDATGIDDDLAGHRAAMTQALGAWIAWESAVNDACLNWATLSVSPSSGAATLGATNACAGGGIYVYDTPGLTYNSSESLFRFSVSQKNNAGFSFSLAPASTALTSTGGIYVDPNGFISPPALTARTVSSSMQTQAWFLKHI